jgi:hypothetical protein
MKKRKTNSQPSKVWSILAAAVVLAALSPRAHALEAKADLNVELRLLQTVPGRVATGAEATGVARIEVAVDALRPTRDVTLRIEKPDGTPWTVKGRSFAVRPVGWTDAGGEPLEPGVSGPSIPSRGVIRTTIEVPLEGAALHEIIVRALGVTDAGTLMTEAVVRAPLGVTPNLPVDDGTFANFNLQGVK